MAAASTFPIPSSLQDLESEPYHLQPYPADFDDADEAARADSFEALVALLERGNRTLTNGGMVLFEEEEEDGEEGGGGYDPWMDQERVQALYTLVR
jgi:condensin complex subunit 1